MCQQQDRKHQTPSELLQLAAAPGLAPWAASGYTACLHDANQGLGCALCFIFLLSSSRASELLSGVQHDRPSGLLDCT